MMIKNISFKINPKGRWKSHKIAEVYGRFSYPVLLTIITTLDGKKIEIPLSWREMSMIIKEQIHLERHLDNLKDKDGSKIRRECLPLIREQLISVIDTTASLSEQQVDKWYNSIEKEVDD